MRLGEFVGCCVLLYGAFVFGCAVAAALLG